VTEEAAVERLRELVLAHDDLADLDAAARRLAMRRLAATELSDAEVERCVAVVADEIDGYGSLTHLLRDERVTDVLVNGPSEVWVEREGSLMRCEERFEDRAQLEAFLERALGRAGVRIDGAHPIASGRLPDGSRLHAVLPPIAPGGPLVSIRRFPVGPLTLDDLVARETLDASAASRLRALVRTRVSLLLSGATGVGKTTLLNALLGVVPPTERVVTVEETPELRASGGHVVSLVAREPNVEGRGAVGLAELVRAALRMRPDRIVVGEVRGPEALTALSAMSTGHEGSLLTIHARRGADALDRLVELAAQSGSGGPEASLAARARRAVGAVVHLGCAEDGSRRVEEIAEVA
jgi:pilus assembly protein CpaF